jgi:hypothetical protein
VFFVHLLLGWTLIGWFMAFIWACSGTTDDDKRQEEERHRELLEAARGNKPVPVAAPTESVEPAPVKHAAASAGLPVASMLALAAAIVAIAFIPKSLGRIQMNARRLVSGTEGLV